MSPVTPSIFLYTCFLNISLNIITAKIDNNNLIIFIVVEKNINFAITISITTVYTISVINIPNVDLPMNLLPMPFSLGVTVL